MRDQRTDLSVRCRGSRTAVALLVILSWTVPVFAQVSTADPELERMSFAVADGFEVELFAAEPMIAKPIQMAFDTRGRLWVVSSSVYPQIRPGEVANDKVIVLEDRDGDGRADFSQVFADGLHIPSGIEVGDGGVYVGNSTELLHFVDRDGDGRADERRVVLTGFGTEDTHHMIHGFRWGPDGQLYFMQGLYIHSHIETPYGVRRLGASGTWRLRTRSTQLEIFTRGLINPWGLAFDRWGQTFGTDGAGGEGVNVLLDGAFYVASNPPGRTLRGLNPGSPKYCGGEFVSGRHLPEDWQWSFVTNDFRANRVVRFEIREEGAGYSAKLMPDVIKSSDKAFRPVDVKMGPDGAIYIADWYNPIINHGEVDFRDPRRDKAHGRIWRLKAKGRPLLRRLDLESASTPELLEHLKSPEGHTRQMARRALYERSADEALPALRQWTAGLDAGDEAAEAHRLEALWTYQTLDMAEPELLARLLRARDARVRAAATRVVRAWHARLSDPLKLLEAQVRDEHPKVRLEAVLALGEIRSERSIELAAMAMEGEEDAYLEYAFWLTASALRGEWLPALQSGQLSLGNDWRPLAIALQAAGLGEAVPAALELLKSGRLAGSRREALLELVSSLGTAEDLGSLWRWGLSVPDAETLERVLQALTEAAARRKMRPAGDLGAISGFSAHQDEGVRAQAVRLAGAWKFEGLRPAMADLALAPGTSDRARQAAVDALASLGGERSAGVLETLGQPDRPIRVRMMATVAMASIDLSRAAKLAAEVLSAEFGPMDDPAPIFAAFLSREGGGRTLAEAIKGVEIRADVAKLGLRFIYSTGRDEPGLVDRLRPAVILQPQLAELSEEQMKALAAEVRENGDVVRGEAVFRGSMTSCMSCHAIGGAGGQLGPDLSSVGTASPIEYLIDSILIPGKAVKEGYETVTVTMRDGDFYSGIRVAETERELVLRDAIHDRIAIPVSEITRRREGGSLMPSGLADLMTRAELVDLIRFLSVLGAAGHDVSAAPAVRRWRILQEVPAEMGALSSDEAAWSAGYSDVSGVLPLRDLPAGAAGVSIARCEIEMTTAGKVRLLFNSPAGLSLRVDDGSAEPAYQGMVLDLPTGAHSLTWIIDQNERAEGLRVKLEEVDGSPGRFRLAVGR